MSLPQPLFSLSKFELNKKIKVSSYNTDFDFIGYNEKNKKVVIFEYLKVGNNQKVNPLSSHPNNYIKYNKGKFNAFNEFQVYLNADIYYINYDENFKLFKVMYQKGIEYKNGEPFKVITIDKSFTSFESFDKWISSFVSNNLRQVRQIEEKQSMLLTEQQVYKLLQTKQEEYNKQLEKAKELKKYKRKLTLPDLSGQILESKLSINLSSYRLLIDTKNFLKNYKKFAFIKYIEVENVRDYELDIDILREEALLLEHVRIFVAFNLKEDFVKVYTLKNRKIKKRLMSFQEFRQRLYKLGQISLGKRLK